MHTILVVEDDPSVQRILQRTFEPAGFDVVVSFDDVEANFTQMVLCLNGMPVPATALEFKILRFFGNNEGRLLSRTELLNEAWGHQNYPATSTVDAYIFSREKTGEESRRAGAFPNCSQSGIQVRPLTNNETRPDAVCDPESSSFGGRNFRFP